MLRNKLLNIFFKEFGKKYPFNLVTGLARNYNKENHDSIIYHERELEDNYCEISTCKQKLLEIEEDIKKNDCLCMLVHIVEDYIFTARDLYKTGVNGRGNY